MPVCTRCARDLPLHDFSDAQLCGLGKCLQCSNPRLFAKRHAADLDHLPLVEMGRSSKLKVEMDGMRQCTSCRQHLPLRRFSARQLSGKSKCKVCAARSSALNEAQQAEVHQRRDESNANEWLADVRSTSACGTYDDDEASYVDGLLRSVEEARRTAAVGRANPSTAMAAIGPSSRGHALLTKLGWEPGTGLGAQSDGGLLALSQLLPSQRGKRGLGQGGSRVDGVVGQEDNLGADVTNEVRFVPATAVPVSGDWSTEAEAVPLTENIAAAQSQLEPASEPATT